LKREEQKEGTDLPFRKKAKGGHPPFDSEIGEA